MSLAGVFLAAEVQIRADLFATRYPFIISSLLADQNSVLSPRVSIIVRVDLAYWVHSGAVVCIGIYWGPSSVR